MRRRLSDRQLAAFCLLAVSAPALTTLCALSWYTVLAGGALCALVLLGLTALWRRAGSPAPAPAALRVWGNRAGAALLGLQIALLLLLLNGLVSGVAGAFPDAQTRPFAPLVLLAVCAWACRQGRDAVVRACGVLFLFLSALLLCVFFFALPDVHLHRLLRPGDDGRLAALGVLLLPGCGLFLTENRAERRPPGGWLCVLAVFPALAAALCAAVPGSRGSFYQMAKSVELLSVAQRVEPLVSVALVIGRFGIVCFLALCAGRICAALGRDPDRCAALACLAAIPGAIRPLPLPDAAYLAAAGILVLTEAATVGRELRVKNYEV